MSDESTKSEYDDILSSVRRIVSTEVDATADAAAGKLLLTPALRVASDEAPVEPKAPERDYPTLEERIADLEAAVGSDTADDWEPDGSEDQTQHKPDGVVLPIRREVAEAREPRVEAIETEAHAAPDEDAAFDQAMDEVAQDRPAPASANTAEPRAPVAPPLATFRHRGGAPASVDNTSADEEPTLLDETGLRELVADIVREELQGGLGERITRNVRKLVRAEIQRAFAARDLD